MSEETQELKIHIVTDADTTGFKATTAASGELGISNSKTAEATEELGKEAEKSNHHHNNSRLLYSELNKIIPGLGHAMHAMHAGAVAPAIAFLMALDGVVKMLEEEKKKSEELAESNAQIFTSGFTAQAEAIGKVKELAAEFNRAMEASGQTVMKLLEAQESKETAILNAKIDGEKKVQAARMESEILAAGNDKDKISAIRERYKISGELSGIGDDGKKIEVLEKYKVANEQLAESFKAQAKAAEQNLEEFAGDAAGPAINEERKNQLAGKIKAGSKEFRDEADIFQTAKTFEEYRQMHIEHPEDKMAEAGYTSLKEKGESAMELLKQIDEYKAVTKEISDHAAELKRLQDAVKTTEAKFNDATSAVERLTEKIDSARGVQGVDRDYKSAAADISGNASAGAHIRDHSSGYAEAMAQLQKSQSDGRMLAEEARKAAAAHSENLPAIARLLMEIRRSNEDLMRQIAAANTGFR